MSAYIAQLLVYFQIYLIVALSLNLVVGFAGMLSLAHAAFFAVGAYTYAILSTAWGVNYFAALPVAMLIGPMLSLTLSLPAWRLKGDFFVLASLATQAIVFAALYNWADASEPIGSAANLTNGPYGIPGIPKPQLFGVEFSEPMSFLLLTMLITGLAALVLRRLKASAWGRSLEAMREDELAARGIGKNTRFLKVQVLAIASAFAALAGTLFAAFVGFVDPTSGALEEGILMLSMVLIGGLGNFKGPAAGAAVLVLLPEALRFLDLPDAQAANLRLGIYGVMLVVMMHYRPQGLAGKYRLT